MPLICVIGDAHLLYQADWIEDEDILRDEAKEVLDEFERAMKQVREEHPDVVVFVGDMFDVRTQSRQKVAHREAEKYMPLIRNTLKELALKTGCKIFALRGNHDSRPVLRSLEANGILTYVNNQTISVNGLSLSFIDTHYVIGNYEIPIEEIPKGDVLFMHESISTGNVSGLPEENLRRICELFEFVFNGHMHFYGEKVLGIQNLYVVPAFIPSRRIKNNWVLRYRFKDGKVEFQTQESPFGYILFDGNSIEFKRCDPIQKIVLVELIGEKIDDFVLGIRSIYDLLIEREDKDKLRVWIKTNADRITIDRVMWQEVLRYSDIKTIDIESERPEVSAVQIPSIEEEFKDVAFTRDELIDKLLRVLEKKEIIIVRKLFNEIFTPQLLQSRNPDERAAFKKLLELLAKDRKVSKAFVQRTWDLSKEV